MASTLHNSLVDACVVVGIDDQTGLLPMPKSTGLADEASASPSYGPYQINVLGVFTGTVAFFPCQLEQIPGLFLFS